MCHRIGNGFNTWIWEDPWIPNEPGFIPQARSGAIDNVHLVADLIDQDTRQWDRGKLSILFEPATVNRILNIHLPRQLLGDQVFWCLTSSGEFSVKSAYKTIRSSNTQTHPLLQAKDWKQLWKIKANARLKNLLWKISQNILPTYTALNNRFPLPSLDCYLRNNAPESLEHLFIQCDWVAQIWLMAPWLINLSNLSNISILDWVKIILYPKKKIGAR